MAHFKIRSRSDDFNESTAVQIQIIKDDGERAIAAPLVFTVIERGLVTEPTVTGYDGLDGRAFLQACMNHAWEIGIRPTGFADTTNQVAAIKDHLADMRSLVFNKPPKEPT